ncbi:hypothetical protein BM1_03211 [Bipolaris maydis]|nr:hypothetical protein BM1_03211 [Bipolaris maydis]
MDLDEKIGGQCITVKDHLDVDHNTLTVFEAVGAAADEVPTSRVPEDKPWGLVPSDALPSFVLFTMVRYALKIGLSEC